jgi:hypothetical protein
MRVSEQGLQKQATVSRTLSLYADSPCARMLDVMLSTAPCSVCDTIDMACVACADRTDGGVSLVLREVNVYRMRVIFW